jgi:hypothetical protein
VYRHDDGPYDLADLIGSKLLRSNIKMMRIAEAQRTMRSKIAQTTEFSTSRKMIAVDFVPSRVLINFGVHNWKISYGRVRVLDLSIASRNGLPHATRHPI